LSTNKQHTLSKSALLKENCTGNGPQEASDELLETWVVPGAVAKYDTLDIDYNHTTMYLDPRVDDMHDATDSDRISDSHDTHDDFDEDDMNHAFDNNYDLDMHEPGD